MEDAQGRLTYDLTAKNNITLYVLESYSSLDRSAVRQQLGINSLMGGATTTLSATWAGAIPPPTNCWW